MLVDKSAGFPGISAIFSADKIRWKNLSGDLAGPQGKKKRPNFIFYKLI
jgi:hypothetical protein